MRLENLLALGVLFCLPFVGVLIVAGTVAAVVTPLVASGTATVWTKILKGTKECL
jgi:hypothetical protein